MPLLSPQSLARTYNPPTSRDVWEHVQLYKQTQRYSDDWGAVRVASEINNDDEQPFEGLSRSNVRAWVDGDSKPDAARAVDVAGDLGWTAKTWTPTVRGFALLTIGVFACGSIDKTGWVPSWTPDSEIGTSTIQDALKTIGVDYRWETRESESQADEIRPKRYASILGRALHVDGAPVGDKDAANVTGLPDWLDSAPATVRAQAAELLLFERAIAQADKDTHRIITDRPRQYFEQLAALIEETTGEAVKVTEAGITIPAESARALGLASILNQQRQ